MTEVLKIRTTVKTALKKGLLFKGTIFAVLGCAFLVIGGIFLKPSQLTIWGIPLFAAAFGLITLGLLPYRKITRLENNPNEIIVKDNTFYYLVRGRTIWSTDLNQIQGTAYLEKGNTYGIGLWFKNSTPNSPTKKKYNCDFFLPYFSQRSQIELNEYCNGS